MSIHPGVDCFTKPLSSVSTFVSHLGYFWSDGFHAKPSHVMKQLLIEQVLGLAQILTLNDLHNSPVSSGFGHGDT